MFELSAASDRGVTPWSSTELGLAAYSNRVLAMAKSFLYAAQCSAVEPSPWASLALVPCLSNV